MPNKNFLTAFILIFLLSPLSAFALEIPGLSMPANGNDLADMTGLSAQAYFVQDVDTGQVLINKNQNQPWTPASLTKLVTALVVLDTKPNLNKAVTMTQADQAAGACSDGGSCIKSKPGIKFTVDGLFHAALLPSANNAANALARSTGLSRAEFVARMNQKMAELGASGSTHFNEPTGMDPTNQITAGDYAKVVTAAFSNIYLRQIAELTSYPLRSVNNYRYNQTIKNTDKLLADSGGVTVLGAKTGYLGSESGYNFAALLKNSDGDELAVVVLGEQHLYTAFDETELLASLAGEARQLAMLNSGGMVLGTSTRNSQLTPNN